MPSQIAMPLKLQKRVSFNDTPTYYEVDDRSSSSPDPNEMENRIVSRRKRMFNLRNKILFGSHVDEEDNHSSSTSKVLKRLIPNALWKRLNSRQEESQEEEEQEQSSQEFSYCCAECIENGRGVHSQNGVRYQEDLYDAEYYLYL